MRNTLLALLVLLSTAPAHCEAAEHLVPAGTVFQCTISEPRLSSKTLDVGDPVLCDIGLAGYSEQPGHARLPYASYLAGHFEDFKDPGHFVGKGWMELKFERMIVEPDTVIPIYAKVVGVRGYNVDRQGRIHGRGHTARDTVDWMVPILWPIDLLNLPRRGPRPTLKAETQLSLKVMDDFAVPMTGGSREVSPGLLRHEPSSYVPANPAPATVVPVDAPPKAYSAQQNWWYASLPPVPAGSNAEKPRRPPYMGPNAGQGARQPLTLMFNDGRPPEQAYNYMVTATMLYVLDGEQRMIPLRELDVNATSDINRQAGIEFRVPASGRGR